jgi:hypothetical protein
VDIFAVNFNQEVNIAIVANAADRSIFPLNELSFWCILGWDLSREEHMLTNGKTIGILWISE